MLDIRISTIGHKKQRYDTIGDWFDVSVVYPHNGVESESYRVIRVSDLGDERYEFLVALHELVESFLCKDRGITAKQVDDFDLNWRGDTEPGDDPAAPYYREHQFATKIELLVCAELGIDFKEYDDRCDAVYEGETT